MKSLYFTTFVLECTIFYCDIITEHEILHKKTQIDRTLRGHDP